MESDEKEVQTVESSATGNMMTGGTSDPLGELTDEQREVWLGTGKLPSEEKAAAAESLPDGDKTKTETDGKKAESSTAPASGKTAGDEKKAAESSAAEAASKTGKGEGARERILELNTENRILKDQLAKLQGKPPEEKAKAPAEEAAKPAPKMEDFESLEEYVAAAVKHGVDTTIAAERKTQAEAARTAEQKKREESAFKTLDDTLKLGRTKHADFDTVFSDDVPIIEGSTLDRWLMSDGMTDELRAEVMYHYGSHRDELTALNKLPPSQAVRELVKLEIKLITPTTAEKKNESKPDAAAKKETPVSKAPPPGSEVGTHGTPTEDPRAKALSSGDVESYMDIENRRELAKTSGARR